MHLPCPHAQSMSGVCSIASHAALQYLPDVATHEQTGCAHFWAPVVVVAFVLFSGVISFLLAAGQQRVIQGPILMAAKRRFCTIQNTFQLCRLSGNGLCGRMNAGVYARRFAKSFNGTIHHPEIGGRRPSMPVSARNS